MNMKIVLFTTRLDKGRWAIEKEAKKVSLSCQVFFYKDLVYKNGKIFVSSLGPLVIGKGDRVILRDPYNAGGDYSFFARKLLKK